MATFEDEAFAGAWVGNVFKCKDCLGGESEIEESKKVKIKDVREAEPTELICVACGKRPEC
jgi:hypothetical protein